MTLNRRNSNSRKNVIVDALVIFVDVRGFTEWAQRVEVFDFVDTFINKFHSVLRTQFPRGKFFLKRLGDGAMIVREIPGSASIDQNQRLLRDTANAIRFVEQSFSATCEDFSLRFGTRIKLSLGWGVTKGRVKKIDGDYIGSDINKCSRLCGIARPYGMVIDREDFPALPSNPRSLREDLYEQVRKLEGIAHDIDVWVTRAIANQFVTREGLRERPEVHVAGLCVKIERGQVYALIARRNRSRQLFPNLFEGCGGQLARNEDFAAGVRRHFKLELGIDVDVVDDVHKFYRIAEPNHPIIPGIKFLCVHQNGTPRSENHSELRWVSRSEIAAIPGNEFIQGLKGDFIAFMTKAKAVVDKS